MRLLVTCVCAALLCTTSTAHAQFASAFGDAFSRSFESAQQRKHEREMLEMQIEQQRLQQEAARVQQELAKPSKSGATLINVTLTSVADNLYKIEGEDAVAVTASCQIRADRTSGILRVDEAKSEAVLIFLGSESATCLITNIM